MATLEELCSEIKEKAFKINKKIGDVQYIQYFLTPEQELYQKVRQLKFSEIHELTDRLEAPLHFVDFKRKLIFLYSPTTKEQPAQYPEEYLGRGGTFDFIRDPILLRWMKEAAGVDDHGDSVTYR